MDLDYLKHSTKTAMPTLKALANSKRLTALCAMAEGEKSVGDLEDIVGISQSALSQHLAILRECKLVKTRRDAQTIYYSLANPELISLLNDINRYFKNSTS